MAGYGMRLSLFGQQLRYTTGEDGSKPWARSCMEMGYDVLLVSQFTLPVPINTSQALE